MTQPDAPVPPPKARLSWKTLLLLALAMPAIGNTLMIAAVLAHHLLVLYRIGAFAPGVHVDRAFVFPSPEYVLFGYFLLGLVVNLIGALSILAIRAVWRRLRPS